MDCLVVPLDVGDTARAGFGSPPLHARPSTGWTRPKAGAGARSARAALPDVSDLIEKTSWFQDCGPKNPACCPSDAWDRVEHSRGPPDELSPDQKRLAGLPHFLEVVGCADLGRDKAEESSVSRIPHRYRFLNRWQTIKKSFRLFPHAEVRQKESFEVNKSCIRWTGQSPLLAYL